MRLKSLSWIFIPFLMAVLRANGMAQIATTQIVDTIYHADGTAATGTALIAWPAFTTSAGDQVPAGNTSAVIGTGGALSISLVPNSGAIPVGTYYTVTYHLDDNSVTRQYWVVPQSTTAVKIAAIESSVLPTSVAIQTATKSYVDTAIAAATTGHPLDSSPLVLKSGDTMTGPLVLPGDPVSSLQASTKHYVDAALAAGLATASTLTGQTPDYVPLATSATGSTTSSHFFEQNGTSGVTNPFNMSAHAPNCNWASGPSFTRYKCFGIDSYDDGSTNTLPGGSRNLAAFTLTHNAWGPAGGGGGENRTSVVWADSNNGALATPGIKTVHYSNTSAFGIGDFQAMNYDFTCAAGTAYASDQGCQNYWRLWETQGPWSGTITGGTNTAPTFTNAGGCTGLENQACAPVPGGWMRDTSVVKANGHGTGMSSGALSGAMPWASTVTTDFAPPASSAWGYKINANLSPQTTWDAPVAQTFTLQAGAGSFAAGDHACVIGTSFTEQNIISAVSGTSPTQTITVPLAMPQTSVAIFKGDCMVMSFDADAAHGVVYALPVVSIDGSSLIFPYESYGNNSPSAIPADGITWAHFDGGATSGIHLYAGARITMIGTSSPTAPFPFHAPYLTVSLSPNSAFAVGDTIDSPHYQSQKVDGLELFAGQTMAPTSFADLTGMRLHITGQAAAGTSTLFRGYNDAPTSYYKAFGGALTEPGFLSQSGVFDSYLLANYAPNSTAFYINNHQPGQSSYTIWRDPSWGSLSVDNTSTFRFNNAALWTANGLSTQGGVTAGGGASFGSNTAANISLDVRGDGNPSNVSARFSGGYNGGTPGGLYDGIVLGIVNSGSNWQQDRAYLRLRDDGSGHTGAEFGVINSGSTYVPGVYMSPQEQGNGISIANGHTNCPAMLCLGSNIQITSPGQLGGNNSTIDFGTNYGAFDLVMYDGGANTRYGWGLTPGTMNFVVPSLAAAGGHIRFTDGGDLGAGGAMLSVSRAAVSVAGGTTLAFSSSTDASGSLDTGISRESAGVFDFGNGAAGDTTATLKAEKAVIQIYQGPATAPTGACSTTGWAFSQDGHICFCDGSTWIQKM